MSFLKRADEHMSLMGEMMEKTGVDLSKSAGIDHGLFLRQAITGCLSCKATADCKQWLAEDHAQEAPPRFCRNSRRFQDYIASSA